MTKKRKRIALVLVYMLLVIGGVNLTDFAESHAYFTTNNKDNPLKYQANVMNAYQETHLQLDGNKPKLKTEAPFVFLFDINKGVNTMTPDKYTVTPPKNCSVTRIYGAGSSVLNNNSITLPASSNGSNMEYRDGSLTVEMTCELIIGQNREFKASVSETVKGKTFKYADTDTYKLIYADYSKDVSESVTDTYGPVVGTEIELFEEFKIWITNYSQQYYKGYDLDNKPLSEYITHYAISTDQGIFKNYQDFKVALDNALRDGKDNTTIPGISIIYDSSKKAYTFKAEANLLGYARTYYSSLSSSSSPNFIFYFDSKDESVINEAFDYYLKNYIYKDGTVDIAAVKKYINSQSSNGVAGMVLNGTKILGMGKIGDGYYITKADIIKYMNATYPIKIEFDSVSNMEKYIKDVLSLKQFENTPYLDIIKDVIKNHEEQPNKNFYATLIRQASDTPWIEYIFKYIDPTETEDGYYTMLVAWTDGVNGNNLAFNRFKLADSLTLASYEWKTLSDTNDPDDPGEPYLRVKIDSTETLSTTNQLYAIADPIVKLFGLDPSNDYAINYSAYRENDNKTVVIDLREAALLNVLSKQELKLLSEMTSLYSARNKVSIKKPSINTDSDIPPLEVEDSSKKEETETNESLKEIDEKTSCADGETGLESLTPDTNDDSSDESTEESTTITEKIVKKQEESSSYSNTHISDNPSKEEDAESFEFEELPKIK